MGMNLFGIGPFEFILFLLIALLILGPERMISASRSVARFIRNLIISPTWRSVQQVQSEMRNIPNQLLREAGLEKIEDIIPTPEEIAKEAGLNELAQQVEQVKQQVQGEWKDISTQSGVQSVQSANLPPKPAPVSPPDSGVPTISKAPPPSSEPGGPPTIKTT